MTTDLDSARAVFTAGPDRNGTRRVLRVAVVNGSPSEKSKTMGLVDVVLQTLASMLADEAIMIEQTRVDVYRLGPAFTGALEREGIAPRDRGGAACLSSRRIW